MASSVPRIPIRCARWIALRVVRVVAGVVAAGYFFCLPRRAGQSVKAFRALLPERGWRSAFGCAWRQYQDFASVYAERLEAEWADEGEIVYEHEGREHLAAVRRANTGAVLLMSHLGRWQLAARMLPRDLGRLVVFMGATGPRDSVPAALHRGGMQVHAVRATQVQAADIFEAVAALREGAWVSMTGDRPWGGARTMQVPFLGHEVAVNVAPFALAQATGAPLFFVFAYKVRRRHYRFVCSAPRYLRVSDRSQKEAAFQEAARAYLAELECMMRAHPEQWHSFGGFLRL